MNNLNPISWITIYATTLFIIGIVYTRKLWFKYIIKKYYGY